MYHFDIYEITSKRGRHVNQTRFKPVAREYEDLYLKKKRSIA